MPSSEKNDPVRTPHRSGAIENPDLPAAPFKKQDQEWPGLEQKMQPEPDIGETSYKGTGRLKGKRALITGGDSGIGAAVAIAFAREGADVAIAYYPSEQPDADRIVKLIEAEGRTAAAFPVDIREEQACVKLVEDAVSALGGLEVLVNNAGRQQARETIEDLSTEDFDATFKTNVYAPFWITKQALKHMGKGGSIIVTSSVNAFHPSKDLFDYSLTKGALKVFAQGLAKQLVTRGIRVNAVCPGPFWTVLQTSGGQPTEKYLSFGEDSPMGRPGMPVEIAPVYVLLASDEASYITGEYYGVTGGSGL